VGAISDNVDIATEAETLEAVTDKLKIMISELLNTAGWTMGDDLTDEDKDRPYACCPGPG